MENSFIVFTISDIFGLVILGILILGFVGYGLWALISNWFYKIKRRRK